MVKDTRHQIESPALPHIEQPISSSAVPVFLLLSWFPRQKSQYPAGSALEKGLLKGQGFDVKSIMLMS